MSISIKATLQSSRRRFTLPENATFSALESQLSTLFSLPPPFTITYQDDENDIVHLSTDTELHEALALATKNNISPLRLHIYEPDEQVPDLPPAPTARVQNDEPQQQARGTSSGGANIVDGDLKAVLEGITNLLGGFAGMAGMGMGPMGTRGWNSGRGHGGRGHGGRGHDERRRGHGFHGGHGGHGFHGGHGGHGFHGGHGMGGGMGMFAPMFSMFGGGREAIERLGGVNEETRNVFQAFKRMVVGLNGEVVSRGARSVMPIVIQGLREIGEGGVVGEERIEGIVGGVERGLEGIVGGEGIETVKRLVRVSLKDQVVLAVIRELGVVGGEVRGDLGRESGASFDVHQGVECDNCGKGPIVGTRYKCVNVDNYDLCGECHNDSNVSKEGKEFAEYGFMWQAELGNAVVPPAPLEMGERGGRVGFLQKLLTDLGYMNSNMYARRVGVFGGNTRRAVMQFQREYGLEGVAGEGVYDATTAASLASIIDAHVPPAAAAGGTSSEATGSPVAGSQGAAMQG